jgi:hypothetical protein
MKKLLAIMAALALYAVGTQAADGTVSFSNAGSIKEPVYAIDTTTKLEGSGWLAQLYYSASDSGAYKAVDGAAAPFRTGAGAGYWNPGTPARTLTGIAAGSAAFVKVYVWEAAKGANYEAAAGAGGTVGQSVALKINATGGAGEPPSLPADMVGFKGQLQWVPEPSTIALGVLGAAALLIRRRK